MSSERCWSRWSSDDDFASAVTQGQVVADIGTSGFSSGVHLHFGAQAGAVQGDRRSGNDLSLTEIPGNWFYSCYQPPPNLLVSCPSIWHGVAEYPAGFTPPAWTPRPNFDMRYANLLVRHISDEVSPNGFPSAYTLNVSSTSVEVATGGNPDSPAFYQVLWPLEPDGFPIDIRGTFDPGFVHSRVLDVDKLLVFVENNTGTGVARELRVAYPNLSTGAPHITMWHDTRFGGAAATLEFDTPGATSYAVWESAIGAQADIFYLGEARSIGHSAGSPFVSPGSPVDSTKCYAVQAFRPLIGWSTASRWVCP